MTALYQLTNSATILRTGDGASIPADPANLDYKAYLAWVAAGNTADPVLTLPQAQAAQSALITAAHDAAIAAGPSCSALGTAATYPLPAAELANLQLAYTAAQAALASPKAWASGAVVPLYEVALINGVTYLAMAAGITGATAPSWPSAFQQVVSDGSVQWALAGWQLLTASGRQWHTPPQVIAAWQAALDLIAAAHSREAALLAEITAAATVAAVQAVVW